MPRGLIFAAAACLASLWMMPGRGDHHHQGDSHGSPEHGSHCAGAKLSAEDQALAKAQNVCPVSDHPLDSMGGAIKIMHEGSSVRACCKGCV